MKNTSDKADRRKKRRRATNRECHACRKPFPFCWTCRCGFAICPACMDDNIWGMSCNMIIWQCPDCGDWNGFGNQ